MSKLSEGFAVTTDEIGQRLDQVLAARIPDHSRARLQRWIKEGQITVDGARVRPSLRLTNGQQIEVNVEVRPEQPTHAAQNMDLQPVHVDAETIIINKPAGLVVHPAAGNADGTLLNALLHFDPDLAQLPRAGIVHRLDKDTTGLMVVARTLTAHTALVRQLQARSVTRKYQALVYGRMISGESINLPLGRHPVERKKMAVKEGGRAAVTHVRVGRRFRDFSLLDIALETGRTHQIRVHLAYRRFPLVGDPVYGVRLRVPAAASETLSSALSAFRRQALHACQLSFDHPADGRPVSFRAALPDDMQQLLDALAADPAQQ